jgi:starch-binding outer membrane protein, SusD/RagB family
MKKIVYILTVGLILINTLSCRDKFLDLEPLDKFSEESVWKDPALMQSFVNNIYLGIPHGYYGIMLSSAADESMAVWDFESSNITKGLIDPSYKGLWDEDHWTGGRFKNMSWANGYKNIRACNLFLEKVETAPFDDENHKNRLIGEVHFLRAYLYHNLVSLYGGVPIITKAYGLKDDYLVVRDSFDDCIKFISEECDKAAALLPLAHDGANKGRATRGAALALKSRTLLYAASDLYHNTSWAAGFSKPELIGYVGGDRTARWQAARDAAKAVIDLGVYNLYQGGGNPVETYSQIFLQKETSEDIFVGFFLQKTDLGWDNYNPGLYNGPNGYHNWGGNTPIGQLADDYEMSDGSRFDWNNPAHKAAPYANRDPRFYASVLYEGAQWRQRPADVIDKDPEGIIQVGTYEKPDGSTVPGLDTRKSPIEDWNGTYTGYYLKKFMDPTVDAQYFKQDIPWRFIRYTEVLLNYAEASLALGDEAEARKYINMIRQRVGMPETNESGQALIDRYRNERRVELAYEDHRYFDIRRWMIAPQVYGDAQGVEIRGRMTANNKVIPGEATFKVIEVQERAWQDRGYFLPIKLDEVNRNSNLVQNPLY